MSRKVKIVRIILITLGCCCILAAAALSLYNRWLSARAADEADRLSASFSALLENAAPSEPESGADSGLEDAATDTSEIVSMTIDGYDVCGSINIPAIDIELAVISNWSYKSLNMSACRYSGSPDAQLIIMAHNYAEHFGRLKELEPGDTVRFAGVHGDVYTFEVIGTETWATNQLQDIVSGDDWDLTLFTCTYSGANRVVVRCVLTK